MKYIWVNPVAAGMYEPEILDKFLKQHGYQRFETSMDWLSIVREKYGEAVKRSNKTVIDMRCPKAARLVREMGESLEVTFPDIYPILIHCGQEAGFTEELLNAEKIITTPCKALADMGNALGISKTKFISWNEFLTSFPDIPKSTMLKHSPIPLGFFEPLNLKCKSLTGKEEIENYFKKFQSNEVQLVEMLYCKDGCHNGDGVVRESNTFDSNSGK